MVTVKRSCNNCENLIGAKDRKLINTSYEMDENNVPILLIVFGIIDFATALFSSKEDDMKKKKRNIYKENYCSSVSVFGTYFSKSFIGYC